MPEHPPKLLDLSHCQSPVCLLRACQALRELPVGGRLEVLLSSSMWAEDLRRIVSRNGGRLIRSEVKDKSYRLLLCKPVQRR